ncbi:glycosyl hydrolase family 28-related protein [Cronobacter malonaticus]|uniref:tail fiber/spike domain-containing protein n=1 Tax=Cronobacter malonaticus TaxID=413503 RepID=UPI0024C400ED|nr:glycosyl hydrolase family 28-related protein [Cronobacter malonaticus]MDK1178213.1 glycosyl hydrolase family 28-related protein [Cronobacter malonaticus]MDK1689154.1 glycosyl hydrolase family 28-related protein [Cronobacter malonaticus]
MATQPTNLPVPSESPRDLKFNAGKIDEFVTSMVNTYIDRFGNKHYTIEGLRWLAQQAIANYGWILKESFEDGYTITLPNEALLWESNGEYYRWDGALPKEVPAGSTPESTGGIGVGAWIGIGDAALKTMLASTAGSSMIGMEAGGTLKDVIKWITPEQFGAKGDGTTNDTASIQAAIDWTFNNGGGIVRLGPKVYRAANLTLKPRVVLQGQTKETSMIKAPNNWTGNAVVMWQGYLTYKTDSATTVTPGCFSAGLRNITIHGNKQNFSGTPSQTVGNGVLAAGANLIIDDVKIIYVPAVGLVTLDWGANRTQYQAADPDRGWAHIGIIRGIRIQFCGNDCWHCEAQDYYLDDVEIVGAGDGFTSETDTFSFWQPDELVANFRVWRNVDLGFFHSYGNYNGYGLVAGGNTSTFFIRIKYESLILESCCVAGWFKSSSYVQGGKLDYHEISQQKVIAKHGSLMPAALIVECSNTRASNFGSVECVQSGGDATIPDYSGVLLYLAGQFNIIECLKISRSPTIDKALRGTGVVLEGANNRINSGVLKGFFGTDNRATTSSCIVASSGYHYINIAIGFANVGVRLVGGHLQGEIKNMGNLTTWQIGMESETTHNRAMLKLYSDSGSNIGIIRGGAGAVNTGITTVQTISITGLSLPYLPAASEVTPHIVIDASNGSSIPPQVDSITYIASSSTVNQLTFLVRLTNSNSPMQVTIGARLN